MTKEQKKEQAEAIARLREWIKPGDTVYTILRHRSASGMSRVIDCKIVEDGRILHIGYNVAKALGYTWVDDREGMRVGGCGMDMGYHIVYALGHALFKDAGTFKCPGTKCPHNSHFNEGTPRDGTIEHTGDMGYTLNHSWL